MMTPQMRQPALSLASLFLKRGCRVLFWLLLWPPLFGLMMTDAMAHEFFCVPTVSGQASQYDEVDHGATGDDDSAQNAATQDDKHAVHSDASDEHDGDHQDHHHACTHHCCYFLAPAVGQLGQDPGGLLPAYPMVFGMTKDIASDMLRPPIAA